MHIFSGDKKVTVHCKRPMDNVDKREQQRKSLM